MDGEKDSRHDGGDSFIWTKVEQDVPMGKENGSWRDGLTHVEQVLVETCIMYPSGLPSGANSTHSALMNLIAKLATMLSERDNAPLARDQNALLNTASLEGVFWAMEMDGDDE